MAEKVDMVLDTTLKRLNDMSLKVVHMDIKTTRIIHICIINLVNDYPYCLWNNRHFIIVNRSQY